MTPMRSAFCNVLVGAVAVALAVFVGLLFDRKAVVDLNSAASSVWPNPARMGEPVFITWSAKANRNCGGVVIPRVINSTGRIFEYARSPTVYQNIMQPGEKTFTKTLTLPQGMAPGPARYQAVVIRWCNQVQEYFWPMVDEPFPIAFEVEK